MSLMIWLNHISKLRSLIKKGRVKVSKFSKISLLGKIRNFKKLAWEIFKILQMIKSCWKCKLKWYRELLKSYLLIKWKNILDKLKLLHSYYLSKKMQLNLLITLSLETTLTISNFKLKEKLKLWFLFSYYNK